MIKDTNRMQKSLTGSKPFCLACLFCKIRAELILWNHFAKSPCGLFILFECDTVAWSFSLSTGSGSLPTVPGASQRKGPDTAQTGLWLSEKIILM